MTQEAPGKFFRNGISLMKLVAMLPDEHAAVRRFKEQRWPEHKYCPHCASTKVSAIASRKPMLHRC